MANKTGTLHKGSINHWLSSMEVGEVRWRATELEWYINDQRSICGVSSRRPERMREWKFSSSLFTAVAASSAGNIQYLLRVERTA